MIWATPINVLLRTVLKLATREGLNETYLPFLNLAIGLNPPQTPIFKTLRATWYLELLALNQPMFLHAGNSTESMQCRCTWIYWVCQS